MVIDEDRLQVIRLHVTTTNVCVLQSVHIWIYVMFAIEIRLKLRPDARIVHFDKFNLVLC